MRCDLRLLTMMCDSATMPVSSMTYSVHATTSCNGGGESMVSERLKCVGHVIKSEDKRSL